MNSEGDNKNLNVCAMILRSEMVSAVAGLAEIKQASARVVQWRRRIKQQLIQYKGGKCSVCGYDKDCPSAYEFHHRDPSTKL
jgi:hypothetical protein